jgi:hypothetical protein
VISCGRYQRIDSEGAERSDSQMSEEFIKEILLDMLKAQVHCDPTYYNYIDPCLDNNMKSPTFVSFAGNDDPIVPPVTY